MSENIAVTILKQLKQLVDDVAKLRRDIHRLENDSLMKPITYYYDIYQKNKDNFQSVLNRNFVLGYCKTHERDEKVENLKADLEARSLQIQNFNCEDVLRMSKVNSPPARLAAAINMLEKLKQELDDCQDLRRRIEQLSSNLSVRSTKYYCDVLRVHMDAFKDSEFGHNFAMTLKMEDDKRRLKDQLKVRVASILNFNYDAIFKGFGI